MKRKISISPLIKFPIILGLLLILIQDCDMITNPSTPVEEKYWGVEIGSQVWMDKNLSETHYRNGDSIPLVTNRNEWQRMRTGAYCYYGNDTNNIDTYGLLYNWYAVADTRNIAPSHWHVPSNEEWNELLEFLGGDKVAGRLLKEKGKEHWICPIDNINESDFSALPGGFRMMDRVYGSRYDSIGIAAGFWTTTQSEFWNSLSKGIILYCDTSRVFKTEDNKMRGYSVRCIENTYLWTIQNNKK